jgi:MFS family permease
MTEPVASAGEVPTDLPAQHAGGRSADASLVGSRYARYVLFVLVLVYVFNFIDRQIISILAEDIRADLGISDADLGFLYGTVFAVFYALCGIPLGRLADGWIRKSQIAIGLAFWSLMTALSGTARSFAVLASYRIGVGVGEASASPAAFSMLCDYFPPRQRATVMAIYSSGVYIGGGLGIAIGGVVLDTWRRWFPDPAAAPFGMQGWHMAFLLVGLPGLLLALWVRTLREPLRGMSEGLTVPREPHPFRIAGKEFAAVLPGVSLFTLLRLRAGIGMVALNLGALVLLAAAGWSLYRWLGSPVQWIAMGLGLYSVFTWTQTLILRSPAVFTAIFRNRTVMLCCIGFPCIGFVSYGSNFFAIPYLLRAHDVSSTQLGTVIGLSAALAAWMGITTGGYIADRLKQRWEHGRLLVGIGCILLTLPLAIGVYFSPRLGGAYVFNFLVMFVSPMYIGPAMSTVNDLVPPQMRGTVSAIYLMMMSFIGLAMGPFTMGQISAALAAAGGDSATSLRAGVMWGHLMLGVALVLLVAACFTIRRKRPLVAQRPQ